MKVLLNIDRELLADLDAWHECEGIKFREEPDGSLGLLLAKDLEEARAGEARQAELMGRIQKIVGKQE